MKIEQFQWSEQEGWDNRPPGGPDDDAQLVLLFGSPSALRGPQVADVTGAYRNAYLFGCSTAGEIRGTTVRDETLVATAVHFERTEVHGVTVRIDESSGSRDAGRKLAAALPQDGLAHVLVLSDGIHVNGSDLVAGLTDGVPEHVLVTGGLSADGDRFKETMVVSHGQAESRTISAIGLYGSSLRVGCGSLGGWDPFGTERVVTRSKGNVLYELDGRSALELYKEYLGEHASGLPATGLLFPLSLRSSSGGEPVVRTILSVDEAEQSMTFAGDVPQGTIARLMKANFNRLIDGAAGAARVSLERLQDSRPDLAILISCVGRKLVLKQRVEEEVEGVRDVLGDSTVLTGFYSYGEISPFTPSARCELHNQTMTITSLSE